MENILHYPKLDSILMVEKAMQEMKDYSKRVKILYIVAVFLFIYAFLCPNTPVFSQTEGIVVMDLQVVDTSYRARDTFSSNEKLGFIIDVENDIESAKIYFIFMIIDPKGKERCKRDSYHNYLW